MNPDPDINARFFAEAAAAARHAARILARATAATRNAALLAAAAALRESTAGILTANDKDLTTATGTTAFQDRLRLTPARIAAMADGLVEIARPAGPAGPHARAMDPAQRPRHHPHPPAHRRDRHDL